MLLPNKELPLKDLVTALVQVLAGMLTVFGVAALSLPLLRHNLNGIELLKNAPALQASYEAGLNNEIPAQTSSEAGAISDLQLTLDTLKAINSGQPDSAAQYLLQASALGSNYVRSLEAVSAAMQERKASPDLPVPMGLPEYQYAQAIQAMLHRDWSKSLEYFQSAVNIHPGKWSDLFYARYKTVLTSVGSAELSRLSAEEAAPPASSPQQLVGRKVAPWQDMPLEIANGWKLQGFSLRTPTALNLGFPLLVDFFWLDKNSQSRRQSSQTWNLLANGGFEQATTGKNLNVPGWAKQVQSVPASYGIPQLEPDGRKGGNLVLSTSSEGAVFSRYLSVKPGGWLLWSTWVQGTEGSNPNIFVTWLDHERQTVQSEIPLQGVRQPEAGRNYAGVLQVPAKAEYLLVTVTNYKAAGKVEWDNLMILELKLPSSD